MPAIYFMLGRESMALSSLCVHVENFISVCLLPQDYYNKSKPENCKNGIE